MLNMAIPIFISVLSLSVPFPVAWKPLAILIVFLGWHDHWNVPILPVFLFAVLWLWIAVAIIIFPVHWNFVLLTWMAYLQHGSIFLFLYYYSPSVFSVLVSSVVSFMRPFHSFCVATIEIASSEPCIGTVIPLLQLWSLILYLITCKRKGIMSVLLA